MIYWVRTPCSLVGYNVSEESAASTFRVEVKMVKPANIFTTLDRWIDRWMDG
jgi:hypothetical protein